MMLEFKLRVIVIMDPESVGVRVDDDTYDMRADYFPVENTKMLAFLVTR